MKKVGIFCFVMAAMTCMCFTSCSKDSDDDNKGGSSKIVTPLFAEQALTITPETPIVMNNGESINNVSMSESGGVFIEAADGQGGLTVYNGSFTYNEGVYNCQGQNFQGTVTTQESRAAARVKIDIVFIEENGDTVRSANPVSFISAVLDKGTKTGDGDIVSTWKVRKMRLELSGEISLSKDFEGGNLKALCDEAVNNGAVMTDSEIAEFDKVLKSVTFRTSKLTFDYSNGKSDAATWNWVGTAYDKISIKLVDRGMGNKFLVDDPAVSVEFNKAKGFMNISFAAKITGSKNYDAILTFMLSQQADVTAAQ